MQYLQRVSRIRSLSRTYVVDLLIALLLIAAMLEVLVGRDSPAAPHTTLWFVLPAIAILVLPILALGDTPLANSLLTADTLHQPEKRHPLNLAFCAQCALVQITETVSPDALFSEYLLPFEIASVLLLVAVVGSVVMAKKRI